MSAVPDLRFRDQLAEALWQYDTADALGIRGHSYEHTADALLPLIAAEVDARIRAAANVERVARVIYEADTSADDPWSDGWDETGEFTQERYRRLALAAITVIQPAAVDPDRIACPHHGQFCNGPRCCCADRHATNEQESAP